MEKICNAFILNTSCAFIQMCAIVYNSTVCWNRFFNYTLDGTGLKQLVSWQPCFKHWYVNLISIVANVSNVMVGIVKGSCEEQVLPKQ